MSIADGEGLVGIDSIGQKHLLIPSGGASVPTDDTSNGVALTPRILRVGHVDIAFLDLHCKVPSLELVFDRLVDDVLARIRENSSTPIATCVQALDDWRTMLRRATSVTEDAVLGLTGELEILALAAELDAVSAANAWIGPNGGMHDFVTPSGAIEVKTTASPDASAIRISSLDQLDPPVSGVLVLSLVHVAPDVNGPSIDDRIDRVLGLGFPRQELLERIANVGYVYESQPPFDTRFSLRSITSWLVGEEFPGLRRSKIATRDLKGVSSVKYNLATGSLPESMKDMSFQAFLESLFANG
ncbi:PD-(D/E)XK motif protein [Williamsia sp. SKLECPSW1]